MSGTRAAQRYAKAILSLALEQNSEVDVYNDIRYTTFALMSEIATELQDDFHSWKTDCIFCTNNELIINKVKSIILSYGLNCKIEI